MRNALKMIKNSCLTLLLTAILALTVQIPLEVNANEGVPPYAGNASVSINNNVPSFSSSEISTISYEKYGNLDKLGRCTSAIACVGQDLMPTEKIESIGMIKPTGWHQNQYEGLVDSDPPYLYNRCHLLGYQLTGEGANEKNLVTGTRYMNIEGMLPYENMIADYVNSTGNHVMYRVTPIFEGNNLLCTGVTMEAYSVEDNGRSISFNVFCYNVQPGVIINYSDGTNCKDESYTPEFRLTTDNNSSSNEVYDKSTPAESNNSPSYIANKNTKKFHYPSCSSVSDMKEKNKEYYYGSRDELIDNGYTPCKRCKP